MKQLLKDCTAIVLSILLIIYVLPAFVLGALYRPMSDAFKTGGLRINRLIDRL